MQMPIKEFDQQGKAPKAISSLFQNLMERFTVVYGATLFTPSWEALETNRCPICCCRLYKMKTKPLWLCKSTSHKGFIIRDNIKREVEYELSETRRKRAEREERQKMYLAKPPVYQKF